MSVRHFERGVGPGNEVGCLVPRPLMTRWLVESPDFFFMGLQIFLYQGLADLYVWDPFAPGEFEIPFSFCLMRDKREPLSQRVRCDRQWVSVFGDAQTENWSIIILLHICMDEEDKQGKLRKEYLKSLYTIFTKNLFYLPSFIRLSSNKNKPRLSVVVFYIDVSNYKCNGHDQVNEIVSLVAGL